MSIQSQEWRRRAADDRAASEATSLPNAKTKLLQSAERFELLAAQAERMERAKV